MTLQARLFDFVVAFAVAAFFHELIVRRLKAEVVSLRKDISVLPGRTLDALVERGIIPQNRAPEARSFVAERFPQWLGALAETLAQQGFTLTPTDVSGKQAPGPTNFGAATTDSPKTKRND